MKVKILKPVSSGKGKLGGGFFKIGQVIDFQKDISWNSKTNIAKQAQELEGLGYIEIVKEIQASKLAETVKTVQTFQTGKKK